MPDIPQDRSELLRLALTIAIGAVGAVLFYLLSMPLPFMLGAIALTMVVAVAGVPVGAPMGVRRAFISIIGAMMGASFSAELFAEIGDWAVTMAAVILFIVVAAVGSVGFFWKVGGYDLKTAYFAGMPGGLTEMITMAEDTGADVRRVTLCHALRVLLIVSTIPWIVQFATGADLSGTPPGRPKLSETSWEVLFWLGLACVLGMAIARTVKLPAGDVLAPMLVSAVIHIAGWSDFQMPLELVIIAQVVLGSGMGARFVGATARELLSVVPSIVGSVAVLLAITGVFAVVLAKLTGLSAVTILLSYSPGGLTEMGLVAIVLGIDPAFVAAHHLVRVAIVAVGAVLLFRRVVPRDEDNPVA